MSCLVACLRGFDKEKYLDDNRNMAFIFPILSDSLLHPADNTKSKQRNTLFINSNN